MSHLRVGFFTEIYRPVVNGVVTSVDTLAEGLRSRGHEVYCFAPRMPGGTTERRRGLPAARRCRCRRRRRIASRCRSSAAATSTT